jgi:ssDNA-binding Zn-finger/Zn-ribbon topoisomerase 1
VSDPRSDEVSTTAEPKRASEVKTRPTPRCPDCGEPMQYYGGSGGYICHDYKVLVKAGGWFDESGAHFQDRRLNDQTIRELRRH